jgi:hypothetical protein
MGNDLGAACYGIGWAATKVVSKFKDSERVKEDNEN